MNIFRKLTRRHDGFIQQNDDDAAGATEAEVGPPAGRTRSSQPIRASWLCCGADSTNFDEEVADDSEAVAAAAVPGTSPPRKKVRMSESKKKIPRQEERERPPTLLVSLCVLLIVLLPFVGVSTHKQCLLTRELLAELPADHPDRRDNAKIRQ